MKIAIVSSQKGYNEDCDGTMKKNRLSGRINTRYSYQPKRTLCIRLVIFLSALVMDVQAARSREGCPSMCTCRVETRVFCNNEELIRTPIGFKPIVEELYLFNNNISNILPATLQPLTNLKILDVSGNHLTETALWDGIFTDLKLLESLMLQQNRITRINKGMFKGLQNLARIYLHDNQIRVIESGSFDNLPNLIELKLRKNRIVQFPKFQGTPNLLLLDLGSNRITTIRDMTFATVNVEQLSLRDNQLTELRTAIFDDTSRLTQLDISNNRLTASPQIIKSLTNLRTLNMSLNRIDTLSEDTFSEMDSLKSLYLSGMGLKTLPQGIIEPSKNILNNLDLTDNDWDCSCEMSWMASYIRNFKPAITRPDDVRCSPTSKLSGRRLMKLTARDFGCSSGSREPAVATTLLPPSTTTKWKADPCEVYFCFNGGTCYLEGNHPKCSCASDWTGDQCTDSLTPSTTTSTVTSKTTTMSTTSTPPRSQVKRRLLINPDSITEHTVEIIIPNRNIELVVSINEIGGRQPPKEFKITPRSIPFTVQNLESGRTYNICIHLPLTTGRRRAVQPKKDTLCGIVSTLGIKIADIPASIPEITVVPSPGVTTKVIETPEQKETSVVTKKADSSGPASGGKLKGGRNDPQTEPAVDDLKILYPAIGASIGAVIIIIVIIMFCICKRQKRILKLKQQNGSDYTAGSPIDNHNEVEMQTVVHHHLHNHYNAGSMDQSNPSRSGQSSPSTNTQSSGTPKTSCSKSSPNKASANNNNNPNVQSRSSRSSSRSSGTSQPETRYTSIQAHPAINPIPKYEQNGILNGYNVYRGHETAQEPMRHTNHCQRPQNLRDSQPLLSNTNSYYGANDSHIFPVSPMNSPHYITPPMGNVPYSPSHNAHLFQPIQSPLIGSPVESMPGLSHRLSSHMPPPSVACLNRNLVNESMTRYHDGVQVV